MLSLFEQHELSIVLDDFTIQVLDAIKNKQIKRKYSSGQSFQAPVMASGKLYDSVQKVFYDEGGRVICEAYIDKLIFGQPPGDQPETSDIEQWLKEKGLSGDAFKIGEKIWRYGNSIYMEWHGANSGLLSDVNIQGSVEKLKEALTKKYADQVAAEIVEQFNVAA